MNFEIFFLKNQIYYHKIGAQDVLYLKILISCSASELCVKNCSHDIYGLGCHIKSQNPINEMSGSSV